MNELLTGLTSYPVVPAIRNENDLTQAISAPAIVIFLLGGDISTIGAVVDRVRNSGKLGLLHIDLVDGLAKDESAIRYLSRCLRVDGIVSTRSNLINMAKREGMVAVQRIFMLDSGSIDTGMRIIGQSNCDAVEVMPGLVLPDLMERLRETIHVPIIAGGLVTTKAQVDRILKAGAVAVSTGERTLWDLKSRREGQVGIGR